MNKHEYTPVPKRPTERISSQDNDDESEFISLPPHHRTPDLKYILVVIAVSLTIFSSGVLLGVAIPEPFKHSVWSKINSQQSILPVPAAQAWEEIDGSSTEGTQCGNSWQDAVSLGCHFDVMASRWYAPECFDQEALDTMLAEPQVNFTWYVDREHTAVFPPEKALKGEFDKVWPDNDFHIKHCLYLWRRLHRAVVNNRPIDEDLFDYEHTLHCTRMILEWMEPGFVPRTISFATSGRPFCRRNPLGWLSSPQESDESADSEE